MMRKAGVRELRTMRADFNLSPVDSAQGHQPVSVQPPGIPAAALFQFEAILSVFTCCGVQDKGCGWGLFCAE